MGEELLRTGYSRQSVVAGMAGTARVISSAALIVVAVFMGFAPDPNLPSWLDRRLPPTGLRRTQGAAAGLTASRGRRSPPAPWISVA